MRGSFLALLYAITAGCSRNHEAAGPARGTAAPVPVNVAAVITKDMPFELRTFGTVESISSVGIKAQVGGELIEVNFCEGQEVKRGDLLLTIQPKLYAVQLAQAEATATRDRAAAGNARRDADRSTELGKRNAISKEELDQILSTADAAEATVKADEASVEIARVRLGYTTIESPIDGRTGALKVKVGNLIKENADTPILTINQMAPIYVAFAPPEQHLPELRSGHAAGTLDVTAIDPATNQPLARGSVTFIDNTVDPTTGTVMLKATFPNDDRALWPGAFVDVVLRLRIDRGVTVAPAAAVAIGQRGPQVFVVGGDGTAELRLVTVGRADAFETIIEQGLRPGEHVVTNGQSRLVPGAKVVVAPPDPDQRPPAPAPHSKPDGA